MMKLEDLSEEEIGLIETLKGKSRMETDEILGGAFECLKAE